MYDYDDHTVEIEKRKKNQFHVGFHKDAWKRSTGSFCVFCPSALFGVNENKFLRKKKKNVWVFFPYFFFLMKWKSPCVFFFSSFCWKSQSELNKVGEEREKIELDDMVLLLLFFADKNKKKKCNLKEWNLWTIHKRESRHERFLGLMTIYMVREMYISEGGNDVTCETTSSTFFLFFIR